MNDSFDTLSRILASTLPRRETFRLVGGLAGSYMAKGLIGSFLVSLWSKGAEAAAGGPTTPCGPCPPGFGGGLCLPSRPGLGLCCPAGTQPCSETERDCCPIGDACCLVDGLRWRCCQAAAGEVCCGPDAQERFECCDLTLFCCCVTPAGDRICQPLPGIQPTAVRVGPPAQIEMEVRDYADKGLVSISIVKAINATVDIPDFPPGTTYVDVVATKIDQKKRAQVILRACTACGEATCCHDGDPVLAQLQILDGRNRVRESFSDIPAAEHFVTIQNGRPGLHKLHVSVNGQRAASLHLGNKEVRTIDIAAAMTMESQNIITLTGQGWPGASALILISDVPGLEAAGADSAYQPLVQWEPATLKEGVNMHWGGGADF